MLRILFLAIHFMVFVSSPIVTGLLSYFLRNYAFRSTHIIFQEVIATITVAFYLFGMLLPLVDSYRGYLSPLNLTLSYLWLTSFIFAAQDWSGDRCAFFGPGAGGCGKKHTIEAFTFLTFFLLCNTLAEAMLLRSHRTEPAITKNGGTSRATDNSASVV